MAYPSVTSAMDNTAYDPVHSHQQHMVPINSTTYHSADGTQAFAVDEYGRHWQLPPAPKLTSAAARSWHRPHHVQDQPSMQLPFTAPWVVSAPHHNYNYNHPHQGESYVQQPVGPQQHYDIEQQMMLQHQVSRQQSQRSLSSVPLPISQQAHPSHLPPLHYPPQNHSNFDHAGWEVNGLPSIYQQPRWPHAQHLPEHTSSQAPYGHHNIAYAHPSYSMQQGQAQESHAAHGLEAAYPQIGNGSTWHSSAYNSWHDDEHRSAPIAERRRSDFPSLRRGDDLAQQDHPIPTQQPPQSQDWYRRSHQDCVPRETWDSQAWRDSHGRGHSLSRSQAQLCSWPEQADGSLPNGSQPLPLTDRRSTRSDDVFHQPYNQDQAIRVDHTANAVEPSITKDPGPTPPSPKTLECSGVSISAFGAEIIWLACFGLLEPHLILEAHREGSSDDHFSQSSTSRSSSPLLSTPLTTPQSPSPGGKDLDASARILSNLGPNHALGDGPYRQRQGSAPGISTRSATGPHGDFSRATDPLGSSGTFSHQPSSPSEGAFHDPPLSQPQPLRSFATGLSSPMQLSSASSPRNTASSSSDSKIGLDRTKSQERCRGAVLSVLALISPHWQWTVCERSLPTLSEESQKSFKTVGRARSTKISSPLREGHHYHFSSANVGSESSPAFRRFAHQVLAQTLLSPTAFMLGLLYALRVPLIATDSSGNVDPKAIEVFASPPSAAPFKVFTLGLMIANKHLDDNTFLNKTWSEVTGIPLAELNKMEQYYLIRCNYEIALPDRVWTTFLKRVKRREESKILTTALAKAAHIHHTGVHERGPSSASRATSPSSGEEMSKKVMSVLTDMLSAVLPKTSLDPIDLSLSPKMEEKGDAPETDGPSAGGLVETGSSLQQPPRPTSLLMNQHEHCRSAPAGMSQCRQGAIRPDGMARSLSECATASSSLAASSPGGAFSSSYSPTHHHHRPRSYSRLTDAPLAPSTLLDLLNTGRSLTSAH